MEKEFVPYELAVKLKALKFDEPCFGYYHVCDGYTKGYAFCYFNEAQRYESDTAVLAPTFSQAFRWFREKHQLYCGILTEYSYGGQLHAYHITGKRQGDVSIGGFNTYEEAELACLTKLIEIVEQKL